VRNVHFARLLTVREFRDSLSSIGSRSSTNGTSTGDTDSINDSDSDSSTVTYNDEVRRLGAPRWMQM